MSRPWPLTPEPTWYLNSNWLQQGVARNGVFYEGDTVVIPRTAKFLVTDPSTADFEKGTNGNTISSADAGSYTPFTSVFGAPKYDNTHAASGSLSMKIAAADTTAKVDWHPCKPSDGKTHYGRVRLYATANPTANVNFATFQAIGVTPPTIANLFVSTTGKVTVNTGTFHAFSTAIPLNQWCRIEWKIVNDTAGAGSVEVRLFTGSNDVSPAETVTVSGLSLQNISANGFTNQIGTTASTAWGSAFWLDDLATNAPTWPGPGSVTFPTLTHDYEIRDFWGNVVSSGSFDEYECTPTPPDGGWANGWYRAYFTGTETDSVFGESYGATQFCVIRDDPHFPAMPDGGSSGIDVSSDLVMKGVMGLGTSRLPIQDVSNLTGSSYPIANLASDVALTKSYWTEADVEELDPNRPRYLWVNVPGQGVDKLYVANGVSNQNYGVFYCADPTIDGSQVFVAVDNGTVSGKRFRIYSPNNSTLVETFDNQASAGAAQAAINAGSSYVRFFAGNGGTATNASVAAIGRTYYTNMSSAVSTLYPLGVTRFEGPSNEPAIANSTQGAQIAHEMRLFQAAVHAGNASALAIGPCSVVLKRASIEPFFTAGGASYCDEISVHGYNAVDGDIHIGRSQLADFVDMLADHGLSDVPLWQTESTQGTSSIFVHVPHKNARWFLWNVLMLEQYGFPRERNNAWYDKSHGFWSFPAFLRTADGAVTPQVVLGRVLAEETWGKPFDSAVDFGTPGNDLYLGNLYVNPDDGTSVVVVLPTSSMENGALTFTITGASDPVVWVDGFGNETTTALDSGKVTMPVTELPIYLRLPSGVSASVAACNDWESTDLNEVLLAAASVGGTSTSKPIDNAWMASYDGSDGNAYRSPNSPPEDVTITFSGSETIDRVIVWSGFMWQNHCALVKFDVQTSTNGTDWFTQRTVDHSAACSTFLFGTGTSNTGTSFESFYTEPWVFDVSFEPVEASAVRLMVDQTTFGGMPDEQSGEGQFQDNGVWQPQHVTIQEMKVYSASVTPVVSQVFSQVGAIPIGPV